jgi:outer membrane immunogenic protein
MRAHLLSGVAVLAIIVAVDGAALAADAPVRAVKSPPAVVRAPDWNGWYVGGHIGYGQAKYDSNFGGFGLSGEPKGLIGGVHVGQNWQTNTFVYGWEADISATGLQKHVIGGEGGEDGLETNTRLLASLRGRLGMEFNRALVYLTGGLAYSKSRFINYSTTIDSVAFRGGLSKFGGVVGLGAEWKQTPSLSWRLEGLYYMFGGGKSAPAGDTGRIASVKIDNAFVVRLGATHHFGAGDAPVPVGLPVKAVAPQTARMLGWSGSYVGGHVGYGKADFGGTITVGGATFGIPNEPKGIVGGMHVGQNWQTNTFVYGWEADLSGTGWDQHVSQSFGGGNTDGVETNVKALASLRGRLGMTFDRTLLYLTGGLAYVRANAMTHSSSPPASAFRTTLKKFGGVAGLGVEWKQSPNFSWRLEGLYYAFSGGKSGVLTTGAGVRQVNFKLDDAWVVRFGLTHHFDSSSWGITPLAAK